MEADTFEGTPPNSDQQDETELAEIGPLALELTEMEVDPPTTSERPKGPRRWKNVILDDDETVELVIHTSFFAELVAWSFTIIVVITLAQFILPLRYSIILGMIICIAMLVRWWFTRRWAWAVTNRRVISRLGFLSKTGTSVSYNRVTDIDVKRPFMSQFFGQGRVNVNTAAGSGDDLIIYGQRDPEKIESIVRTFAARMNSSPTETATGHDDDNDLMAADPRATQERTHSDGSSSQNRHAAGTPFVGIEGAASSLNAAQTARRDTATWFLEQVWTPNDPETYVQLRRVHYRYLTQDTPQRADGQTYTNSLRNWRYLQRAAAEAARLGWLGTLLPATPAGAHYHSLGEIDGGLHIWAASHDLDDVLLPLCQRLELPYLSYASALSWTSLIRFTHKTCNPKATIIYVRDYDPWLEPIASKQLAKQLNRAEVNLHIDNLALSVEQVEQHALAPTPSYDALHPSQASKHRVELAALEGVRPGELARLVENAVDHYRQRARSESTSMSY
jgi:membrane protein YdbS with pleckstrin-like domain